MLCTTEFGVTVAARGMNLSAKAFRILELFSQSPNWAWFRDALMQSVWGTNFGGACKPVDVHIRWRREKIEADPANPQDVTTLRGFGYRFGLGRNEWVYRRVDREQGGKGRGIAI